MKPWVIGPNAPAGKKQDRRARKHVALGLAIADDEHRNTGHQQRDFNEAPAVTRSGRWP
jgi:hypothetical protein